MNRKVIGRLNSDDLTQLQKAEQDFINFAVLAMQSLISCKYHEDNIATAKRLQDDELPTSENMEQFMKNKKFRNQKIDCCKARLF